MKLSIVLITYNFAQLVTRSISSVLENTGIQDYEIIVVDNASTDGTPETIRAAFPQIQLIENATNTGFSRACNQATRLARGEYIVLLNSDCFLRNDTFGRMLNYMEGKPEVGIVGARLLNPDLSPQGSSRRFLSLVGEFCATLPYVNKLPIQCFHRDLLTAKKTSLAILVDYVSGACFMFRRSTFDTIGGFDERFFMYSEEEEFCYRARRAGILTAYVPSAEALHISGASFGENVYNRSALVASSRLKYYKKYHSSFQVLAFRVFLSLALMTRASFGFLANVFPSARSRARIYTIDALVTLRTYLFDAV
jgi:N-acetylglucosaminyl-diphospho-decaprenol L-rhamnosyltransferase